MKRSETDYIALSLHSCMPHKGRECYPMWQTTVDTLATSLKQKDGNFDTNRFCSLAVHGIIRKDV